MISAGRAVAAITNERERIRRTEVHTPFVSGIIEGLFLAQALVQEEDKKCNKKNGREVEKG